MSCKFISEYWSKSFAGALFAFGLQVNPAFACQICDGVYWHEASIPMKYELRACLDRSRVWVAQAGFVSQVSEGFINPVDGYVVATKMSPLGSFRVEVQCLPSSGKGTVIVSGANNNSALAQLKALLGN
jgi:hypothetical protein